MKKMALPKVSFQDLTARIQSVDRKTLIQNVAFGGSFLAFILFFFVPILMHNGKLGGEVDQLRNRITQANVKITRVPEMARQKELFGARTKQIREQFFGAEEVEKVIEILSTQATDVGVKITASRPSMRSLELPPPFGQMYTSVSYELVIEGGYHNIGRFINQLETYEKNMAVHSIEITAVEETPNVHRGVLTLTAFMKLPGSP